MEVMGKSSYHGQSEACSVYTSVQTLTLPPIICAAMSELLKIISLSFFICRMEIFISCKCRHLNNRIWEHLPVPGVFWHSVNLISPCPPFGGKVAGRFLEVLRYLVLKGNLTHVMVCFLYKHGILEIKRG